MKGGIPSPWIWAIIAFSPAAVHPLSSSFFSPHGRKDCDRDAAEVDRPNWKRSITRY